MKKRFLYLAVLCLVCSLLLSACSLPFPLPFLNKDGADIASDTDTTVAVQNTVNMMDLEGVYSEQLAHRGTLRLTAKDSQTAAITIDWPGSATESAHWEMTGTYDPQKQAIVYNDAVMMEQTKSETGAQSNRLVSSSGTGRFTISGKNLAWTDDLAYIGSDPSTFTYSMSLGDDMNQSGSSLVMGTPSVSSTPGSSTAAVQIGEQNAGSIVDLSQNFFQCKNFVFQIGYHLSLFYSATRKFRTYLPWNAAFRFSMNAEQPSLKSSVLEHSCWVGFSTSSRKRS